MSLNGDTDLGKVSHLPTKEELLVKLQQGEKLLLFLFDCKRAQTCLFIHAMCYTFNCVKPHCTFLLRMQEVENNFLHI